MHLFLYKFCILLVLHCRNLVQSEVVYSTFGWYDVVSPQHVFPAQPVPPAIARPPYVNQSSESVPSGILIKTSKEIEGIRASCHLAIKVLKALRKSVRVGVTTEEIDAIAHEYIISQGAYPSPLGYENFPKSICTSVNNVIIHGIPDNRTLRSGDIVSVDISVYLNGYHGDTCATFTVGQVDREGRYLVESTREILYAGIKQCRPGVSFQKLAQKVSEAAHERKLTVISSVSGHGIGKYFHEKPFVWHDWEFTSAMDEEEKNAVMEPGMVFTIEPAIGQGKSDFKMHEDKWTMMTIDDSRVAQFEHTILITEDGHQLLTK